MLLARLEVPTGRFTGGGVEVGVLAVQEVVGRCQCTSGGGVVGSEVEDGVGELLINHDRAEIVVVVSSSRTVDDDRTTNTTAILRQQMAVVPTSTIDIGNPGVCSARAWGNTAFSDTRNTILVVGAVLQDTVPVDSGCVALHIVGNGDRYSITPVGDDRLTWSLTVDGEASNGTSSISVDHSILNNQVVGSGLASGELSIGIRAGVLAVAPAGS